MAMTPEQRRLRASAAAYARWAKEDPKDALEHTRMGFRKRFYDEVDPGRVLPQLERERRAEAALRSHMQRLALRSSRARSRDEAVG